MGKVKAIGEGLKAISQYALPIDLPVKRRGVTAYHGSTERDLKELSSKKAVETRGTTWHTTNPDVAETFTVPREYGEPVYYDERGRDIPRGAVYETQIAAKNPLELTGEEAQRFSDYNTPSVLDAARRRGHDAVVAKDVLEGMGERSRGDVYAVLDDNIVKIIGKYGIAGALGAGLITAEQAEAAKAQGLGDKGDRLGTPSKDEIMAQRLALARQMSGSADRRATGATGTENAPVDPLTFGGALASGLSGARNSVEDWLGSGGGMRGMGNLTPQPEQVRDITDRYTPKPVQDWTRYESKSPVEQAWKWLAEQVTF